MDNIDVLISNSNKEHDIKMGEIIKQNINSLEEKIPLIHAEIENLREETLKNSFIIQMLSSHIEKTFVKYIKKMGKATGCQ
jgi:uncharacterized membrane protein